MSDQLVENGPLVEGTIDRSNATLPTESSDKGKYENLSTDWRNVYDRASQSLLQSNQPKRRDRPAPIFPGTVSESATKERETLDFLFANEREWRQETDPDKRAELKNVSDSYVEQLREFGWSKQDIKDRLNSLYKNEVSAERTIANFVPEADKQAH